jgi:hypothetical protein
MIYDLFIVLCVEDHSIPTVLPAPAVSR